jgi:uncharacterized protein
MEPGPGVLPRLLDLQTEDTALKRLADRKATLPESKRLEEITDALSELEADLVIANSQYDEVAREASRLEGEVELLEQKITREEQRLFSGGVSNPKELSSLQAEVESLKRRRSSLEDELLEVMVKRESAGETLARLKDEQAAASKESEELRTRVDEISKEIDIESASHEKSRTAIASEIPSDLLALYDKLRGEKAGIGAARLEGATCLGCHMKLPAQELERMRSEGGLQRCDNCRRILVVD